MRLWCERRPPMLPPVLRFDLRPRRVRLWLRVLSAAMVVGAAAAVVLWLQPRQVELKRLRMAGAELEAAARHSAPTSSTPARPAPWEAVAEKDGNLLALPVELGFVLS